MTSECRLPGMSRPSSRHTCCPFRTFLPRNDSDASCRTECQSWPCNAGPPYLDPEWQQGFPLLGKSILIVCLCWEIENRIPSMHACLLAPTGQHGSPKLARPGNDTDFFIAELLFSTLPGNKDGALTSSFSSDSSSTECSCSFSLESLLAVSISEACWLSRNRMSRTAPVPPVPVLSLPESSCKPT